MEYEIILCVITIVVLLLIIIIYYIAMLSNETMVNYGREAGSLYRSWPYNPTPDWTAVDRNYGYMCTLGGRCELVRGGLLTQEECDRCSTEKIHLTPPWKVIA